MDKPADPATPFGEVYQAFLDDLALEGIKPSTIQRYRNNILRFEKWLVATDRSATLASLEQTTLIAYKRHLQTLPQQPGGWIRRRRGGLICPGGHRLPTGRAWPTSATGDRRTGASSSSIALTSRTSTTASGSTMVSRGRPSPCAQDCSGRGLECGRTFGRSRDGHAKFGTTDPWLTVSSAASYSDDGRTKIELDESGGAT